MASAAAGKSVVSAIHVALEAQEMGGHGNDAGPSMTFFTLLNLGIHITTPYVAVN